MRGVIPIVTLAAILSLLDEDADAPRSKK